MTLGALVFGDGVLRVIAVLGLALGVPLLALFVWGAFNYKRLKLPDSA